LLDSGSNHDHSPDEEPPRPDRGRPNDPNRWRRPDRHGKRDELEFWEGILFPTPGFLTTPGVTFLGDGPYGNGVPAGSADLARREAAADDAPEDHVRLLPSFAIAHDPKPGVVGSLGLPLPLGRQSPNLLVIGRSGSGKTESVTFPSVVHALEQRWAVVVINVKGQKQTRVIRRLAHAFGRGDEFMLVAPRSPDRSLGYNPLATCTGIVRAKRLAEFLVSAAGGPSRHEGGVWAYNQAADFLKFAIEAMGRDLPAKACTLPYLRDVIVGGFYEDFARMHRRSPFLRGFARHVERNSNGETVANTVAESTAFVDELAPFLGTHEVDFGAFARNGGVLVVEIDGQDIVHLRVVIALLLGDLLHALQETARSSPSSCLPHKTLVAIDELAAAGPVPDLPNLLHTCRDMRLSFVAGTQSLAQLPAIYGRDGDTVASGFQTKIALGGGLDMVTAELISRATGMATCIAPTAIGPDDDGGLAVLGGWQTFARPVFLPGEIANPRPHPLLGPAATVVSGDGATPAFQVHLAPAYGHGALARLAKEAAAEPPGADRRPKPLKPPRRRFRPGDGPLTSDGDSFPDDDEKPSGADGIPF
jgi:hypothetical protein